MSAYKDDPGPGLAPALFLGFLSFLIGVVLGTVSMVSREATPLTKSASTKSLEPGTVYYVRGDRLGSSSWEEKETAWKAGNANVLTVSESELNQWSTRTLQPKDPATPASGAGWMDKLHISVSPVNFRILEDGLQVATEVKIPGILGERSFVYQVVGDFVELDGGVRFVPVKGTVGSAPLGSLPGVRDVLFSYVSSLYGSSEAGEWLPQSLGNLDSVMVSEGQLVLKRG